MVDIKAHNVTKATAAHKENQNCFSLPTLHMSTIALQIQASFSPAPHISSGFVVFLLMISTVALM